jgi:hypothetical protein
MKLYEMYDQPVKGYQDPADDNSRYKWTETRKTKLTLRQIRKLRKMLDVRNYEYSKNLKKVRKQYEPVSQETPAL